MAAIITSRADSDRRDGGVSAESEDKPTAEQEPREIQYIKGRPAPFFTMPPALSTTSRLSWIRRSVEESIRRSERPPAGCGRPRARTSGRCRQRARPGVSGAEAAKLQPARVGLGRS